MKLNEIDNLEIISNIKANGYLNFIDEEDASNMDIEYQFGRSGNKSISTTLEAFIGKYSMDDTPDRLGGFLGSRFDNKWERLYNALESSYELFDTMNEREKENVGSKITNSSNVDNSIYAFNSQSPSPTQKNSIENVSSGNKEDNERTLERHGLGSHTPQEMINREFELRVRNLYTIIYKDIDSVLVSDVYED